MTPDNPFFALMENAMIPTQQGMIQPGPATMPQGAPAAPQAPQGGGTLESILRAALPALAGFYAGRQGQLGTFANSMAESQGNLDQQEMRRQQLAMQQQRIEQDDLRQAQALARDDRNYQERHSEMLSEAAGRIGQESERQRRVAEAERVRAIQGALGAAAFNPELNEKLRTLGPDAFVTDVPGFGKMNLGEMLQYAVAPKNLGDAPPEPKAPSLVDDYQKDGSIRSVPNVPGLVRRGKPDKPEKADKPDPVKPPTVKIGRDDDVEFTNPATGVTRSTGIQEIADALGDKGYAGDLLAMARKIAGNPQALVELFQ